MPSALKNIPLEYFDRAVGWLSQRGDVIAGDLSIVGTSRGAELALLLASHRTVFKRVVGIAPSHVVWGPVGVDADKTASAWTLEGQPLPFVSFQRTPDYSAKPYRGTPDFLLALQQPDIVERARIQVERIQGAVLLLSGEDDQIWPSALMARMVIRRLAAANHRYHYEHMSFPGAGHLIDPGSDAGLTEAKHPTGVLVAFGGTESGNRAAQAQGWTKTRQFLRQKAAE